MEIFKGKVIREVFYNEKTNFGVYGLDVDTSEYMNVKANKYGNVSVSGVLPRLSIETEYGFEGEEEDGKYGVSYKIEKITKDRPTTKGQVKAFLKGILTDNDANVLLSVYPNIIDLIINNGKVDLSLTKGIKEKRFAIIKRKVINDICLIELLEEFKQYEMTFTVIRKLYDEYKNVDLVRQNMERDPYSCLTRLGGVAFKSADTIILRGRPTLIDSELRMSSAIEAIISENENRGNTWIGYDELKTEIIELVEEAYKHFVTCIKNDEFFVLNRELKAIARKFTYESEVYIQEKITNMLENPIKWDIDTSKYAYVDDNKLTDDQQGILKEVCNSSISLLAGYGGTGKSYSTQAVINMLEDNNLSYELMSPTGKASKVLKNYCKRDASTIHRGLMFGMGADGGWGMNEFHPLNVDIVIVDEFSMCDVFLGRRLFEAINPKRTKILFIFDPEQIPSVSCGKLAYDMLESNMIPKIILTKVFRYGEGGLMQVATNTREGKPFVQTGFEGTKAYGATKDYVFVGVEQEDTVAIIKDIYRKLLKNNVPIDDIVVTSAMNKGDYGSIAMNKVIQELANPEDFDKLQIEYRDTIFRVGDKVMQCRNNYKALTVEEREKEIFNGDVGVVTDIIDGKTLIVNIDDVYIQYEKSDLEQLMLAYVVNIYKMQGSQSVYVILVTPKAHTHMLNKNLIYTGMTRATKRVFHVGEAKTVNTCLRKSANFERNTFLLYLLRKQS